MTEEKNDNQYLITFIEEYLKPKIGNVPFLHLDKKEYRKQVIEAICDSLIDLGVDIGNENEIAMDQTIHDMLNIEVYKKLKKKFKYSPAEIDMLPDYFKTAEEELEDVTEETKKEALSDEKQQKETK